MFNNYEKADFFYTKGQILTEGRTRPAIQPPCYSMSIATKIINRASVSPAYSGYYL